MELLRKNRKAIALVGCLLIILGCFLPFASAMGISIDYATGDGKLVIIAIVVTAILIFLKKEKITLIPSLIAVAIFVNTTINMIQIEEASLALGFYVILIGLIAIIAYPFLIEKN